MKYGNLEIDDSTLMTSSANNVQNYVQSLPWSNKRKEKFMNAYQKLAEAGITGATSDTGQWQILTERDVNLEGMDKKDLEMLGEAAHFYRLLMESLAEDAKSAEEEKKEEKKDKKAYSYQDFNSNLIQTIFNKYGGGRSDLGTKIWNEKDLRGENGLRGHTERAKELAIILKNYSDNLKDDDFDFTNSPFRDINDFRGRIAEAIQALNTETDRNILQLKLAPLGINVEDFFNNGSGDLSDKKKADGTPFTYGELLELNEQEAKKKAAELEKLKLANRGVMLSVNGIHGTDAATNPQAYEEYIRGKLGQGQIGYNQMNQLVLNLLNKATTSGLNSLEKQQLGNFLYYIRTKNPNYNQLVNGKTNITDEEWAELKTHPKLGQFTNKGDYIRLPWNTSDGKYTYADNKGNLYFVKPANKKKFAAPIRSANYYNYRNNFLKTPTQINAETPVLSQDKDILASDIVSMLGDVVSIGGGTAGVAGGITTLLSDLYGDIRRGKDFTSVLKNLGANIAWGVAGLIPGAKLGKISRNAARIYAGIQSAGILLDNDVQNSWKNLISGKDLTAKDFENLKWTLHAITGGTNAARGHFTERKINNQIKDNKTFTVQTKSGKSVPLTEEQVSKINRAGGKGGQAKALEEFKKYSGGEEAKENLFLFLEEGRAWYNPSRYSLRLRNHTSDDVTLLYPKETFVNLEKVNELLNIDKAKPWIGIGNPLNAKFWNMGGPNRGGISAVLSPYRTQAEPTSENITSLQSTPLLVSARDVAQSKAIINRYKNILKGNFSKNPVLEGTYKIGDVTFKVTKNKNGRYTLTDDTPVSKENPRRLDSNLNEVTLKKRMAEIVQKSRKKVDSQGKVSKKSTKEVGKILLDLKRKGWLKQGGKITDTQIDNFLKQYKW